MHDGERDLANHIQRLKTEDPTLAHQVQRLFQARLSVNHIHHHRLNLLEGLEGFTGASGVGVCKGMVMDQRLETEQQEDNYGKPDLDVEAEEECLNEDDEALEALGNTLAALSVNDM